MQQFGTNLWKYSTVEWKMYNIKFKTNLIV